MRQFATDRIGKRPRGLHAGANCRIAFFLSMTNILDPIPCCQGKPQCGAHLIRWAKDEVTLLTKRLLSQASPFSSISYCSIFRENFRCDARLTHFMGYILNELKVIFKKITTRLFLHLGVLAPGVPLGGGRLRRLTPPAEPPGQRPRGFFS